MINIGYWYVNTFRVSFGSFIAKYQYLFFVYVCRIYIIIGLLRLSFGIKYITYENYL